MSTLLDKAKNWVSETLDTPLSASAPAKHTDTATPPKSAEEAEDTEKRAQAASSPTSTLRPKRPSKRAKDKITGNTTKPTATAHTQAGSEPSQPTSQTGASEAQPQSHFRKPKIGLALGAGVARGWAHIGIARRLADEGIVADVIAGTSIGAVVGGAMAAGALNEIEDWAASLQEKSFFRFLDWKFSASGLFGSNKLNELMVDKFGDLRIEDLPTPFTAVACELKTGHEIWLNKGRLSDAIQASFALPGVFEPKQIDKRWLVDGALVNPTPVSVCRAQGCDFIIAVNLAEDLYGRSGLAGRPGGSDYGVFSELSMAPSALGRGDAGNFFRKLFRQKDDAPSLFSNMVASLSILQNRLSRSRMAGDPPDVTISPRVGHIGLMEFHRTQELIAEGVTAFDETLPRLRDALAVVTYRMNQ